MLSSHDIANYHIHLGHAGHAHAQQTTLTAPRLRYDPASRVIFALVNLLYGRRPSLTKFYVLEGLARLPYQAWERAAYRAVTRFHQRTAFIQRIAERMEEARVEHDDEQMHLLILSELLDHEEVKLGVIRFRLFPWLMAGPWHVLSWLLYIVRPAWSYGLNAHFEDHAEHEYMEYVSGHPVLERSPWISAFADQYGPHASVADVPRHIGYDERIHKQASLRNVELGAIKYLPKSATGDLAA